MTKWVSLLFVFGMFLLGIPATDAGQTIIGQNNPAVDVPAVQAAVNQGGTISLKGIFDFGDKGSVNIPRDVKISGEAAANGGPPVTKIKRGRWSFHTSLPATFMSESRGPKITIQRIHFDGATWAPISLSHSSGATISQNKITNINPEPQDEIFGKPGLNIQVGISCFPGYGQSRATRKYIPYAFTGDLIIEDNDIDLMNDSPTKTLGIAVLVLWTTGVNAQIQRNTVINCSRNSIETTDNYLGKDGKGMFVIKDNKIVTATEGVPVPSPGTPNGILVGWFFDPTGGLDLQRNIKYVVTNNGIRTRGKTPAGSAAIFATGDGVVIVNNAIATEGPQAIGIGVMSSDGFVAYNRMEGTSNAPAIYAGPRKPLKGSKNVFIDNDLKQFKGLKSDVIFGKDTFHNFFNGSGCKVIDLGSNNLIQIR